MSVVFTACLVSCQFLLIRIVLWSLFPSQRFKTEQIHAIRFESAENSHRKQRILLLEIVGIGEVF